VSKELNMPNPIRPYKSRTNPEEPVMTPSAPEQETAESLYDDYDAGFGEQRLPARARFRFLTPLTAALIALIVGGVGFFVGVRVEKSKAGSSSSGGASAFARAFGGTAAAGGTGATASRTGATGAAGAGGAGGFASFFGRGGAGAGTTGSVTAVDGNTLYVKETSGNTVKVKLTGSTTVSKTESVSKKKIYPGDEVTIAGATASGGTVNATSVTDSGASAGTTGGSASSSSTGSGANGASSAVSSLFGG
jgi:hypothetical protein